MCVELCASQHARVSVVGHVVLATAPFTPHRTIFAALHRMHVPTRPARHPDPSLLCVGRMGRAQSASAVLLRILRDHGPLGLLQAKNPDGTPFLEGRRATAVTDRQVKQLGISHTPQHPETELRNAGVLFESTRHKRRDALANHVVVDGDLITGQNQNAGPMVAREMMQRVIAKLEAEVGAEG